MSNMTSPYKHPKTGVYYFRMAVPKPLVPLIGKTVFKTSLQTKNLTEAKQRFGSYLDDAHKQIELAKLKQSNTSNIQLTPRDCSIIAERWYMQAKATVDSTGGYEQVLSYHREPDGTVHLFGLSDTFAITGYEIESANEDQLQDLADDLKEVITAQLDREGLVVSVGSESFRRLAVAFYHYVYRIESLCRARFQHDFGYDPVPKPIAHEPLSGQRKENAKKTVASLSENALSRVFERYLKSESLKDRDGKTLSETTLQIERLIEVIGDMDVARVTRAHISEFRDTLIQLPKSKAQLLRSKPLREQIEIAQADSLPTVSSTTVKNCLRKVSVVFSYAVELGLIASNPVNGVRVAATTKKKEVTEGKGYSEADLKKLYQLDVFTDANAKKTYGMACYWIPLLCRYTGARIEEMVQLHKSDIAVSDDGIYYLNIRRGEGQSVKSDSSLRHTPIAEHLVELGFLDYVSSCEGVLFPDLKANKYGKRSPALVKWWSNMVKSAGVVTKQPSHSFRHAIKTAMRSLGVSDSVSDSITGHSAKGVGASYGTVELKTKKEVIDRLPRLEITRLF